IGDADLTPASLVVHPGDHVLVAGRSRTGRSSALLLLAERVRLAVPDVVIAAVALRPSPLRSLRADIAVTGPTDLAALGALSRTDRPALVMIDDAEWVDDDGTLAALLAAPSSRRHVVAAGRPDVLRSSYGHWTTMLRRSRLGVLLQ